MNAKALVAVLLLAVAGIAGWLSLQHGSEPAPAPATARDAAAPDAAAPAAPAQGAVDASTVPEAPAAAAADRTAAPVPAGAPSAATVRLRGRAVDLQGAPRPGVALTLRSWTGIDGIEFTGPLLRRERDDRDRPTWTTRSDGTFEVPLPADKTGQLELIADDLVFAAPPAPVDGRKGDHDLGDVRVLRAGSVAGVVRDRQGRGVADVKLSLTFDVMGIGAVSSTTSQADGSFRLGMLRPGKWTLRTASSRFLPAVQVFELQPEEQRTEVVVTVEPGNAIAGQVVDDRGVGVAGMRVGSKRREARGVVDIERFTPDEATTTDAHGFFTLAGLADDVTSVRAFGPDHTSVVVPDVAVGTGNLLLRVERLGTVEGVLQGPDGTPIAGSRVTAQGAGDPGFGGDLMFVEDGDLPLPERRSGATTATDGTFRLEGVRPGMVTLVARGTMHRQVRQPGVQVLPAQATKGVRLVADLGAIARVRVVDEQGHPVVGAEVRAERVRARPEGGGGHFRARAVTVEDAGGEVVIGGGERLGSARTDGDGIATLAGLPAGELELHGKHGDFAPGSTRVALPQSGTVDASLLLRQPGFAAIVVAAADGTPQPGADVEVRADVDGEEAAQRARTGERGEARVGPLAPGSYTAMLTRAPAASRVGDAMVFVGSDQSGIASSATKFTVVAGQTTPVALRRPVLTRVHGIVTGTDGPVVGCVVELRRRGDAEIDLPGFGGESATTGSDGAFTLTDVEPGRYELRFGKPDQVVKATAALEVPANTPELRHDLALRTGKLRVRVVAADSGEPVANAEVTIERGGTPQAAGAPRRERGVMMMTMTMSDAGGAGPEMTTMTVGAQRAVTDEDGVAVVDDVPIGDYDLTVRHKKHAPAERPGQQVSERQETDCGTVQLAVAGQLRGRVVGADGKPPRMAMVQHRALGTAQWGEPTMAMGGAFRVPGLKPGRYQLRAQELGQTPGAFSTEVEVEVVAGEIATTELKLPAK